MQEGIERGLGTTAGFRVVHYGITEVRVLETPEQQVFLWFPPRAQRHGAVHHAEEVR